MLAARGTGGSRDRVMKHSEVNPSAGPPALNEQEPIKLQLSQDPDSLPMGDNPEPLHLGHGIPQDIAQDSTGAPHAAPGHLQGKCCEERGECPQGSIQEKIFRGNPSSY